MILTGAKSADVLSTGSEDSINMSIDTADQGVLMMILSESLYKDPIGSLVREWASNALDAHTEAGVTEPIIVSLKRDEQYNWWFKVTDVGTGMSPDRITNVVSKYAASTKRASDKYLGAFGLGLKSGLAYSDSFTIITRYEGVEYTYIMYKGEEGTKIDLMRDVPTTEKNGTTVQIQLKSFGDTNQFTNKIREQLCYFEGVYFDVSGIDNSFTILKNADWKYSSLSPASQVHLVLNNVYYAIDWGRLGIDAVHLPIGLAFEVGEGLIPTPSREDIKYTEEAKELIKIRLSILADYMVNKYNEGITAAEYWGDIYMKFGPAVYQIKVNQFNIPIQLKELKDHTEIKLALPTLKGIEVLDLEALSRKTSDMFLNYEIRGKLHHFSRGFYGKYAEQPKDLISNHATLIYTDHKPKGVELEYLKDVVQGSAYFLYKMGDKKLGRLYYDRFLGNIQRQSYISLLGLKKLPKEKWRQVIVEYQGIEASIIAKIRKIEDLQPTEEWLAERKANRAKRQKRVLLEGSISLKIGKRAQRGDNNMMFEAHSSPLKDLHKNKFLSVYATNDQREELDKLYRISMCPKGKGEGIRLTLISKNDVKKVQGIHNFISIERFMKGDNIRFKKIATAALVAQFIEKHEVVFSSIPFIRVFSDDFAAKLRGLEEYEKNNNPSGYDHDDEIIKEIIKVAEEYKLWDYKGFDLLNEVQKEIGIFDFMLCLDRDETDVLDEKTISLGREILKGRKFKMDWRNYLPPPTPPIEEEEDKDVEEVMETIKEEGELENLPF